MTLKVCSAFEITSNEVVLFVAGMIPVLSNIREWIQEIMGDNQLPSYTQTLGVSLL